MTHIPAAARLLREGAEELKAGVSINGVPDWANEPETKIAYDEYIAAAELSVQTQSVAAIAGMPEPVSAECRFDAEMGWGRCTVEHHNMVQANQSAWPGYTTRGLYTAAQVQAMLAQGLAPLMDEQIKKCAWGYFEDSQNLPDWVANFVSEIEGAHGIHPASDGEPAK
ncbi:hypothetical protein SAMN05216344_102217 [Polaromonas sp. OV174]|uniref:hypothetical protein n=1 Tax=Polaromonas sp. OV174 TaxID=1855300 RepID=UPI0008E1C976|nr:hypothetical protein [Polaromonas sp. OV174]SFB74718.1 hypothetical protein SAMN05216344_102217 [Polaromonas sp. OV174]